MNWRRTSWPIPVIPGLLNVRRGKHGLRWGIGPRFLRRHVGGGTPSSWSIGFGPETWTRQDRRRR